MRTTDLCDLQLTVTRYAVLVGLAFVLLRCDVARGQGTAADYDRSASYSSRTSTRVFANTVTPHWFGEDGDRFWYRVTQGPDAHRFVLVDAKSASRAEAFDHQRLAELLSAEIGSSQDADRLDLQSLLFAPDASECFFRIHARSWRFRNPAGPLQQSDAQLADGSTPGLQPESRIARSRNGGERTTIRFDNRTDRELEYHWVMSDGRLRSYGRVAAGKTSQISTFDGHAWLLKDDADNPLASFIASVSHDLAIIGPDTAPPKPYRESRQRRGNSQRATSPDGKWRVDVGRSNLGLIDTESGTSVRLSIPQIEVVDSENAHFEQRVWWSPDATHFVLMHVDPGENREIHMIESSPEGSLHARLLTVPYAKPGDRLDHPRPVLFSQSSDWKPRVIDDAAFSNPFDLRELAWNFNSKSFSFLYNQRGHQRLRLVTVNAETAEPHVTIDEQSETFVCYSQKTFLHRIKPSSSDSGGELIWMSERSGWNHLYLIDAVSGAIKNPITSGEWVVREVERVDDERRQLYLKVSGMDRDQDPYQLHLIRVDFDGTDLVRLTDGDGHHRWKFSPNDRYLVDTYSRVDLPPVSELRDVATGSKICDLEQADITSLLETGWRPPERFVAKGRDGVTDIHGVIVRPTSFDSRIGYPVLEEIYAGPHSSFVPKSFGLYPNLYAMAELGFVVVKIDAMGTSNRSKAFHDVCWKNLGDSGFPDRVAWMKAAAETRPEMDLSRVGIWGGSAGGQSAMRALITHGDFYHAAVADCGCHDNRVDKIWWNEQWMGWPIGPHYQEQSNATQAHRLQGDLMLIWGELDRNVDPASTMQVIHALVKADKDFEQLIMPGTGHGAAGSPYAKRRQADFFVRKLWHREPRR